MKRIAILLIVVVAVFGCQKRHPITVQIEPLMETEPPETIAVFPFLSSLHDSEDPDGLALTLMGPILTDELNARRDYKFLSPNTMSYAVDLEEMTSPYNNFLKQYPKGGDVDYSFLQPLATALKCEAFMVAVVDLWQKDEADAQETSTPATYVGATITILDAKDGKVLFRAIDEDYMEGARTDIADRSLIRGASGNIASDMGAKVHRAPPFEEVAIKVINALVSSIPVR